MHATLTALLLSALTLSACASAAPESTPGAPATLAQIRALTANKACAADSQCHSLALGAKSCGGPEAYLAWSSAKVDKSKVEALGERHRAQRKEENERSGLASDCAMVMDPGAVCRAGVCQAVKGASAE